MHNKDSLNIKLSLSIHRHYSFRYEMIHYEEKHIDPLSLLRYRSGYIPIIKYWLVSIYVTRNIVSIM